MPKSLENIEMSGSLYMYSHSSLKKSPYSCSMISLIVFPRYYSELGQSGSTWVTTAYSNTYSRISRGLWHIVVP